MLFNITGGPSLSLFEVDEAAEIIKETADPEANIIFGTVIDERMGDEVSITVIATGFDALARARVASARSASSAEVAQALRDTRATRATAARAARAAAIPVDARASRRCRHLERELPAAAVAQPRTSACDVRRGPQPEVEDLDIPAFLRRNR